MKVKRGIVVFIIAMLCCMSVGMAATYSQTTEAYNKSFAKSVYGKYIKVYSYGAAPTHKSPYVYGMLVNTSDKNVHVKFIGYGETYVRTTGAPGHRDNIINVSAGVASGLYIRTANVQRIFVPKNKAYDNLCYSYTFKGVVTKYGTTAVSETVQNIIKQTY